MKAMLFLLTVLMSFSAQAQSALKMLMIDPNQPLYVDLQTTGLGPEVQCYFGRLESGKYITPVMMTYERMDESNGFEFSMTQALTPAFVAKLADVKFEAILLCGIHDTAQPELKPVPSPNMNATVRLFQIVDGKNQVIAEHSYTEMNRVRETVFWITSEKEAQQYQFQFNN